MHASRERTPQEQQLLHDGVVGDPGYHLGYNEPGAHP
jgi:hypothetical protein